MKIAISKKKAEGQSNKRFLITYLDIKEIKPYSKNPRKITQTAIQAVKNSIMTVGIKQPLVLDKNKVVIAGHVRLKALQMIQLENETYLDFTKIPCVIADDLTKDEIKAYRLIDNKTSELTTWLEDLELEEIGNIETVDLQDFGFVSEIKLEKKSKEDSEDKTKPKKTIVCPNCGEEIEI